MLDKPTEPDVVAVVTGAASGIGLAAAHRFGKTHRLVIADAHEQRLEATRTALSQAGYAVAAVVCDVTDGRTTERLARHAQGQGRPQILIHAAGISPSMADAASVLRVNYAGTANVLAAFEPSLTDGCVTICIASMSGYRRGLDRYDELVRAPFSNDILQALIEASQAQSSAAYALSKRGVMRLVEWNARQWARRGARILSISPGVIDTPMGRQESSSAGAGSAPVLLENAALGRLGTAEEIAALAVMLSEPGASFMTGGDVLVDGGALAGIACHAAKEVRRRWDHPWR